MIAEMNKTEISAKILKRKKSFCYRNHTKNYSAHVQGKVLSLNQTQTRLHKSTSSRDELEFDLSNFV